MTASKAFYKSKVAPKLLHRFKAAARKSVTRAVEIWTTTCIVTNFETTKTTTDGKHTIKSILINSSNEGLTGTSNFPYFPRGGPVPKLPVTGMHKDWQPLGFVSTWGGMEVGTGMLYPVSVIDGLVHNHAGWKLQAELRWLRLKSSTPAPCPVGSAVRTTAGDLMPLYYYDCIVHTTPPFYKYDTDPEFKLAQCYQSAFATAFDDDAATKTTQIRAAVPLLGSGARGFPYDPAITVAAQCAVQWLLQQQDVDNDDARITEESIRGDEGDVAENHASDASHSHHTVAFGLLEQELADQLANAIKEQAGIKQ